MLGIDIVDIKDPSFKERNNRTLDLIKHPEDILIEHPHIYWLLWAAKEAVFKCKREPLNFAPKKIPIQLTRNDEEITFRSENIRGKMEVSEEYILAICGDLEAITYQIFKKDNKKWSEGIRFLIIEFFRERGLDYHIGSDELNLPIIEPAKEEISISHHGRFGAVAFPKSLLA